MAEQKKSSRRAFIGTIAGVVVGGVVGYAGGFLTAPGAAGPGQVVTQTVTAPAAGAPTVTVTAPAAPAVTRTVTAPEAGMGPLKIGAGNPETGVFARDGQDANRSQIMALEELETLWGGFQGGRTWDFINVDVPGKNTEEASGAIRRLVTRENVDIIVTDYITIDATEYEEASKYDIFYINQDTTSLAEQKLFGAGWRNFTAPSDTIPPWPDYKFWNCFCADQQDQEYPKNILLGINDVLEAGWVPPNRKFASIAADNAYSFRIGKIWIELMKWAGWEPVVDEVVVGGTVEWGPILAKMRADPPAIAFNTDVVARDMAAWMNQFREDPTPTLMFGQYSPSVAEFLELTGENGVGMGWQECMGQLHDEAGLDFRERFESRWGERPGMANTGVQFDYQVMAMILGEITDGGWANPRRMSAIWNSGVDTLRSDYVTRGVTGPWSIRPGQTGRSWPFERGNLDDYNSIPHLTYQIQRRGGQGKGGEKRTGNIPTHVLVGTHKTKDFWHEIQPGQTSASYPNGLAVTDDGNQYYSSISQTLLGFSDRFYTSGQWPVTTDNITLSYHDTEFVLPEWFQEVSPAMMRKVSKY